MADNFTQEQFTKHLNTKFRVKAEAPKPIELELVEVMGYVMHEGEQDGLERFSLFFTGPDDFSLPQSTYALEHETLGAVFLFLVPLGPTQGYRYEAVFNCYK